MITTNKLGLPQALVNAVTKQTYSKGESDISVTSLIGPARKRVLESQHRSEMTEDASDCLWRLFGSIGHMILETHAEGLSEHRFFTDCLGWKVSGQVDLIEGTQIADYKMTSAWSVIDGPKIEWVQQLNLYRLLASLNGFTIDNIVIIALLRDWSRTDALRGNNYPQTQVVKLDIPLWTLSEAQNYLETRVRAHQEAEEALPECTDEEKWARQGKFAVMKSGNQKATKLFDVRSEADSFAAEKGKGFSVVERPAQYPRCESYCGAAPWCSFAQSLKVEEEA